MAWRTAASRTTPTPRHFHPHLHRCFTKQTSPHRCPTPQRQHGRRANICRPPCVGQHLSQQLMPHQPNRLAACSRVHTSEHLCRNVWHADRRNPGTPNHNTPCIRNSGPKISFHTNTLLSCMKHPRHAQALLDINAGAPAQTGAS